jgi:hypothetical protein
VRGRRGAELAAVAGGRHGGDDRVGNGVGNIGVG